VFTWWQESNLDKNSGIQLAQAVSRRPLAAESRLRFQVSPCEICRAQSGTGTGFPPNTSVFPCQYHSTNAPYSLIYHQYY